MKRHSKTVKDEGNGNTKSLPKEVRQYCFTWNNYTKKDIKDLISWFKSRKNLEYIFQKEIGKKGTKHLQGSFKSQSPIKFKTLKELFPEVHFEVCRNWKASIEYCSKDDTKDGEVYTNIELPEKLEHGFIMDIATDWQMKIIDLMKEKPDARKIYWIFDEGGSKGKTTLAKYLVDTYPKKILYMSGKASDIKYGVTTFIQNGNTLKMAIFGCPRTMEKFISYQAIEEIKDGIFFNNKYECGMVRYNIPHVVVFANFEPDYTALTEDRWEVITI